MHVRKNDTVMVISGSERGKQGRVIEVIAARPLEHKAARVRVEKLQLVKRHQKPNQDNRTGGIVEKEASIAIANVLPMCPKEDKPRRVKIKMGKDGAKSRVCAKCGEEIVAAK